ncbi:S-layer homology domain-containing protein [Paenarthrobacter nitroguajacolicus]|uniref:S-layer homology domain-containing protein n=1 Tax=Paenarthrobacter nitroguajacolicus TaxID=211146 RepID=UPI003D1ED0D3
MRVTHKGVAAAAMTLAIAASGLAAGPASAQPEFTSAASNLNRFQPTTADAENPPFSDVAIDSQFYTEITWLADNGISTGWLQPDGTSTFRPLQSINRDAMAAFMYRLMGSPDYTPPSKSPYADIYAESMFYKEVCWVASEGISQGYVGYDGSLLFGPAGSVTRDAMAAFMYRLAGSPDYTPPSKSSFEDVLPDRQFYKEISWLASTGISTGWTEDDGTKTYRPNESINRDAMAAFMYRFHHELIGG